MTNSSKKRPIEWLVFIVLLVIGAIALFNEIRINNQIQNIKERGVYTNAYVESSFVFRTSVYYDVTYYTSDNVKITSTLPLGQHPEENAIFEVVYDPYNPMIVSLPTFNRFHSQGLVAFFCGIFLILEIFLRIFSNKYFVKALTRR